jgi:hypothetical protein
VHLLGIADTEIESTAVRFESGFKPTRFALQPAEIVPAVGQVRVGLEEALIGVDRLVDPAQGPQARRFSKQVLPVCHIAHLNSWSASRRG